LVHIVPRHGHVDLYTDAQVAQPAEAGHGLVVRPGNAPEAVVGRRIRTVQADAHSADARRGDLPSRRVVHERSVGRQRDGQAAAGSMLGQVVPVRPVQRLTPREHQDRVGPGDQAIDEGPALLGREFIGAALLLRPCSAMDTTKVALGRQLPEDQPRPGLLSRGDRPVPAVDATMLHGYSLGQRTSCFATATPIIRNHRPRAERSRSEPNRMTTAKAK